MAQGECMKQGEWKIKHGYYLNNIRHPLYTVWINIKQRCYNKNHKAYKYYGGRGISICDKWLNDPKEFVEWGLLNGWKKGLMIDRIDNYGNYECNNTRFVTRSVSAKNTRLLSKGNSTGYRGVSYYGGQYVSRIVVDRKIIYLGCFKSPCLAALRWDAEAYRLNDGRPRNFL